MIGNNMKYALLGILLISTSSVAVEADKLDMAFRDAAEQNGVDVKLLRALCWVESGHRVYASNKNDGPDGKNSHGICQIKYKTARWLGYKGTVKDLYKLENNTYYAAKYLHYNLSRYRGNWKKAVTAYNRGHYEHSYGLNNSYVSKIAIAIVDGR